MVSKMHFKSMARFWYSFSILQMYSIYILNMSKNIVNLIINQ